MRAATLGAKAHEHAHGQAEGHGHGSEVGHEHGDARPGAPKAPADVLAYLNGQPVPRQLLDDRLTTLRDRDTACVLPKPDTREARQLARWVAQVIITEQLCEAELRHQGELTAADTAEHPLDVSAAISVGSINAAALASSAAVRQVAELVSRGVLVSAEQFAYAADVLGEEPPADPAVPTARWHAELLDSARLEAFTRWLNAARHERVQLVHGLEHPGDSDQPDNLHRH